MKKILAAAAILLTLPSVLTSCGENDEPDATGKEHYEDYDYGNNADRHDNSAENFADEAVDDVESAADDIMDGAGNAANDIIDGFEGEHSTAATSVDTHISTVTATTTEASR